MTTTETLDAALPSLPRWPEGLLDAISRSLPKFYFKDWAVDKMINSGIPVVEATTKWTSEYTGDNSFVLDVKAKVNSGRVLSPRQARALLNCAMKDAQEKGGPSSGTSADITSVKIPAEKPYKCFVCDERFDTVREAANHRVRTHRGAKSLEPEPKPQEAGQPYVYKCRACDHSTTDQAEAQAHRAEHRKGLFDAVPETGLDLTQIPTGRYAAPNLAGDDYIFLTVAAVKKTHTRSKKFRFGWVSYGYETIQKGTLEIRQWRGDTKELVGEQRIGETYRGSYAREFEMILRQPTAAAKLFGTIIGCCGRCGRTLTDPESRKRAIGPDCIHHFKATDLAVQENLSIEQLAAIVNSGTVEFRPGHTEPVDPLSFR